jgi:hypothetical protein
MGIVLRAAQERLLPHQAQDPLAVHVQPVPVQLRRHAPVVGALVIPHDLFDAGHGGRFRNKVGLDVTLEALREVLRERRCRRDDLYRYARINRVERVMRPYMEALS